MKTTDERLKILSRSDKPFTDRIEAGDLLALEHRWILFYPEN
jgi:hypothetical protein